MNKNRAFTLIELIMVMVIIGVLAVVAIPKFVNIQLQASLQSEEAVIGALRSAIQMRHAVNVLDPSKGDVWPGLPSKDPFTEGIGPFELLSSPPPSALWAGGVPADGKTWKWQWTGQFYMIPCPHWDNIREKGAIWTYSPGGNGSIIDTLYPPGQVVSQAWREH